LELVVVGPMHWSLRRTQTRKWSSRRKQWGHVEAHILHRILYGIFTLSGWIGGAVINLLKPKLTM